MKCKYRCKKRCVVVMLLLLLLFVRNLRLSIHQLLTMMNEGDKTEQDDEEGPAADNT